MKLSPSLKKSVRIATPVLLALLLTIAILPGAALAQPPGTPDQVPAAPNGAPNTPGGPTTETPPVTNPPVTNPPVTNPPATTPPATTPPATTPPATTPPATTPPVTNPQPQPHPSAPFTPPADCIVAHAATPAQLCPISGGLQYYFIGSGSSQPGPWIQPFSELATLHAGGASIYSGTNPFTGKSVQIHYLPADQKIRVSTFYPDNQYDTNKPYNFTVDANNSVAHEAW